MSRLDKDALLAAIAEKLKATPDPDGVADLVASQGRIAIAASAAEMDGAIGRLKPLDGYRWIVINSSDLFSASPKTIGTKVGIMDQTGRVLKAADLPRPKGDNASPSKTAAADRPGLERLRRRDRSRRP